MMDQHDKSQWYMRKDGRILGPFPARQIAHEILLGRIREHDELSNDREHWRPLSALPQITPQVMRHDDTAEGRQHLLLARLREDERLHDRRTPGHAPIDTNHRHGDRRTVESFDVAVPRGRVTRLAAEENKDGRNLLLPAAVIMIALFILGTYYLWLRPVAPLSGSGCQAAPVAAVDWSGCEMPARNLSRADLRRANLSHAMLRAADLHGAQLQSADLSDANLEGADLRDADLGFANLRAANLNGANLGGVLFGQAIWTDGRVCADESVGECR